MKALCTAVFLVTFAFSALANEISCGGTEPFWGLTVSQNFMRYSDPTTLRPVSLKIVSRQEAAGFAAGNITVIKSKYATLTLVKGECSDGMSDINYTHHAVLENANTILGGCCNPVASESSAP